MYSLRVEGKWLRAFCIARKQKERLLGLEEQQYRITHNPLLRGVSFAETSKVALSKSLDVDHSILQIVT